MQNPSAPGFKRLGFACELKLGWNNDAASVGVREDGYRKCAESPGIRRRFGLESAHEAVVGFAERQWIASCV